MVQGGPGKTRVRTATTACRFGCGYAMDWRAAVVGHEKTCALNSDRPEPEHGTLNGYVRHCQYGERPCDECRKAYNVDVSRRRAPKRKQSDVRICITCDDPFESVRPRRHCSDQCRRRDPQVMAEHREHAMKSRLKVGTARHEVTCQECGMVALVTIPDARFCSFDCSVQWRRRFSPSGSRRTFWIARSVRLSIYERDNWTCQLCGDPIDPFVSSMEPMGATLDHIVCQAWTDEPDHSPENLRLAHRWCNVMRSDESTMWAELFAS